MSSYFKYNKGDRVVLSGLIESPECNGIVVTIKARKKISPNSWCESGNAYYIKEDVDLGYQYDYIYEERLSLTHLHKSFNKKIKKEIKWHKKNPGFGSSDFIDGFISGLKCARKIFGKLRVK